MKQLIGGADPAPSARHCDRCEGGPRPVDRRFFTPEEYAAIASASGLQDEVRDGDPIIAAVLIRRREWIRMSGMDRPTWCDTERPYFACPWSRFAPENRPFLAHGFIFRAATGQADPLALDADGRPMLEHRLSHCPALGLAGYWLKYLLTPKLPRWLADEEGRLHRIVGEDEPLPLPAPR